MKLILILFIGISINSFSQNINTKIFDQKFNDSLLVGKCNISAFKTAPYDEWFFNEYNNYTPNDSILQLIKNNINDIKITIILGIWCSDSRREFPRFIKILDLINYDMNMLNVICVNSKKESIYVNIKEYNIELIPTFIFTKDNNEIGRIIESPKKSLEEDFLNLIF